LGKGAWEEEETIYGVETLCKKGRGILSDDEIME
jgi:hypothetical protein